MNELLDFLGVTKQSLNRVLRQLVDDGLVESRVGLEDRRHRNLHLTAAGALLEQELSAAQRRRMRAAFSAAGPEAVHGFRKVLEQMIDPELRDQVARLARDRPVMSRGGRSRMSSSSTTTRGSARCCRSSSPAAASW